MKNISYKAISGILLAILAIMVLTALLVLGGIGLCVYGLSIFGSLKIILGYLKKR